MTAWLRTSAEGGAALIVQCDDHQYLHPLREDWQFAEDVGEAGQVVVALSTTVDPLAMANPEPL
ncbi:hypothetical protein GCM10022222_85720 [Amycolatopsis ultiminotia]|uniref:Uncharacterized protein n=1 Tax=Amycolatopsis ultiminotia TaxID=543629 RepID=A0ABP6YQX0_9PSEU